jgi:octaprenyl-diphosphate synthase
LAAVVEFIHTATLLHDDVVDESACAAGAQTANAIFGNAASVLVGDFLYSRAFQMMVSVDRMRVLEVLADATNVIAEGEVLQLMNMHDPDTRRSSDYLQVIRFKTAKLFEASAGWAPCWPAPTEDRGCLRLIRPRDGHGLPAGRRPARLRRVTAEQLGKNVGDDLREGKPTLPLLLAMKRGSRPSGS